MCGEADEGRDSAECIGHRAKGLELGSRNYPIADLGFRIFDWKGQKAKGRRHRAEILEFGMRKAHN